MHVLGLVEVARPQIMGKNCEQNALSKIKVLRFYIIGLKSSMGIFRKSISIQFGLQVGLKGHSLLS